MLTDRLVESLDPVERDEPDAKRQDVVLLERGCEERVVRAPVDVLMDPLVELDQTTIVRLAAQGRQLLEELVDRLSIRVRRAGRREPRRQRLEDDAHLGEPGDVADVDARDEDAAPGVHVDETLPRQVAEGLANRSPSQSEPGHQLALAD